MKPLSAVQQFIADIEVHVEATGFEQQSLYERAKGIGGFIERDWQDNREGFMSHVGNCGKNKPIWISLRKAKVDDVTILFWYPTGMYADYYKIEKWFAKHLPNARKTDAMNFHCAFPVNRKV